MMQRRIIASLIVIILFLSASIPVFADEIIASTNAIVGYLTIFATNDNGSSSAAGSLGHAFLSFKNISGEELEIGVYTVDPNEEITFGTWPSYTAHYHNGIWYNLESYQLHVHQKMGNRVSLTVVLSKNDVESLDDILDATDSYDLMSNNCTDFAVRVFGAFSDYVFATGTLSSPNALRSSIMQFSEYEANRSIADNRNTGYAENGEFKYKAPDTVLAIVEQMEQNAIVNIDMELILEAQGA